MVISHKYKYIFVELPFTGSTAVSAELCKNYDGKKIIRKHATYHEFLKFANDEEKKYFVFSGIRHPMDAAVSVFFKKKYNHKGRFTNPNEWKKHGGSLSKKGVKIFRNIQKNDLDFVGYFKKYHKISYDNFSRLNHKEFDFILRFEKLDEDFTKLLSLLEIEQIRPLPIINTTLKKEKRYYEYFENEIRRKSVCIFGPFMEKWNYSFPSDWDNISISYISKLEFEILGVIRIFYWKYLKRRSNKNSLIVHSK